MSIYIIANIDLKITLLGESKRTKMYKTKEEAIKELNILINGMSYNMAKNWVVLKLEGAIL